MKKLLTRFDEIMSAVTFAEAGEFDTARQIMKEGDERVKRTSDRCPHCGEELGIDALPQPNKV